jgi:hypothetical protein
MGCNAKKTNNKQQLVELWTGFIWLTIYNIQYTILDVRFKKVINSGLPLNDAHRTTLLLRIGELGSHLEHETDFGD